ncbi:hypothetical protein F5Y15DRAFT_421628 [Xylariaceae sp. FL0016]|nr:hypothetical protein F5Y15DRAFT_421628 [Xylariaceae sp. FL0016]
MAQKQYHLALFLLKRISRGVPAVILGIIFNLLDLVSTGTLVFPTGLVADNEEVQAAGMAIFLVSIVTSQLALTFRGSRLKGAFGSMLIEVLPFLRQVAMKIQVALGPNAADAVVPTILTAYALCSLIMGVVFFLVGLFRWGFIISYFPPTVLTDVIGSIGIRLLLVGLQLTLPTDSTVDLDLNGSLSILFELRHLGLLFATIMPALLMIVAIRFETISMNQTLPTESADVNRELLGNGAGNIMAGLTGSIPNLIVFSYTRLFTQARGGRWESFAVTVLTSSLLFVQPAILPYVPTIAAGVLVCFIGFDLASEATFVAFRSLSGPEFVVVIGTLLSCTFIGFAIGLGVGLALTLLIHFGYGIIDTKVRVDDLCPRSPLRHHGGPHWHGQPLKIALENIATRRSRPHHIRISTDITENSVAPEPTFQESGSSPVALVSLSVFGTSPSLEHGLDAVIRVLDQQKGLIVIDLQEVHCIESSVSQLLKQRRQKIFSTHPNTRLVVSGINAGSGVHADLDRAGVPPTWAYDSDGGNRNSISAFSCHSEVMAWYREVQHPTPIHSKQEIPMSFESMFTPQQWTAALACLPTWSGRDIAGCLQEEIRAIAEPQGCRMDEQQATSTIYFVVHGFVSVGGARRGPSQQDPVCRPSVKDLTADRIRKLVRMGRKIVFSQPGESKTRGCVRDVESQWTTRKLLLPGDWFYTHEVVTETTDVVDAVVESSQCSMIAVSRNSIALKWAEALLAMLETQQRDLYRPHTMIE